MINKKMKTAMATLAIAAAVVGGAPVVANAGTSYSWSVNAERQGATLYAQARGKYTDSSVRVKYKTGSSDMVCADVYAYPTYSGTFKKVTYPSTKAYYVPKNSSYFVDILNLSYETYGAAYCKLGIAVQSAGSHSGEWWPDI